MSRYNDFVDAEALSDLHLRLDNLDTGYVSFSIPLPSHLSFSFLLFLSFSPPRPLFSTHYFVVLYHVTVYLIFVVQNH